MRAETIKKLVEASAVAGTPVSLPTHAGKL
jgi:hypothetical protein